MKSGNGSRHRIFRTCIAIGFVLGIVLLWQSISTYIYVSGNLLVQAAQQDAERKRTSLQRAIRIDGSKQIPDRNGVPNGSLAQCKHETAWLTIIDATARDAPSAGPPPP